MSIKVGLTREEQIQLVKDCGQSIMANAERIVGDFKYSQGLKIVIELEVHSAPHIHFERKFLPEPYIERIM